MWRNLSDLRAEKTAQNPVTSLAVMVCSVPNIVFQDDCIHVGDRDKGGGGAKMRGGELAPKVAPRTFDPQVGDFL